MQHIEIVDIICRIVNAIIFLEIWMATISSAMHALMFVIIHNCLGACQNMFYLATSVLPAVPLM